MSGSFDVFLSHNSKDKPMVRQLAKALQERGLQVWLDEEQLVPGRPWQEALERMIQTARTAAVLVGQDGLGPWEIPEMRVCLSEFVNRYLPVIPVLLPDAPGKPELPLFLRAFTWVDLRGGLTDEGLDRLEWGITGERKSHSPAFPPQSQGPAASASLLSKGYASLPSHLGAWLRQHKAWLFSGLGVALVMLGLGWFLLADHGAVQVQANGGVAAGRDLRGNTITIAPPVPATPPKDAPAKGP